MRRHQRYCCGAGNGADDAHGKFEDHGRIRDWWLADGVRMGSDRYHGRCRSRHGYYLLNVHFE